MSNFASFIGKSLTKEVPFIGEDTLTIRALSLRDMNDFQAFAANNKDDFEMIKKVVRLGVPSITEEVTDEQLAAFPVVALTKLAETILEFSGAGAKGNAS